MKNIYELTQELLALEEQIEELDFFAPTEELEAMLDALLGDVGEVYDSWVSKIDNTVAYVKNQEHWVSGVDAEIRRLTDLKAKENQKISYLKERVLTALQARGQQKLQTERFKISVCKNGGNAPLILNAEVAGLPEKFQKVTITADTSAIRAALKAGEVDASIAQIGERGSHLRIS